MSDDLVRGIDRATQAICRFRATIRELPVWPERAGIGRATLEAAYDFEQPVDMAELVTEVAGYLERGIVHVTHPRYFGLFNPAVRPAAIVGDLLAAAYNPQLAAWSHAPSVLELERLVLRRLTAILGLDPDCVTGAFTTGGAEANLSAVLAALAHVAPDWSTAGARALPGEPALYLSGQGHDSFVKIARMAGLGTAALRRVPSAPDLTMDADALERMMIQDERRGSFPLMVVATAGSTAGGHIDPLRRMADVAARFEAWYHVDAAWGATAALSPRLRPLLGGIERADSVTWDAHKWLSVPMSAGMFLCRHPSAVLGAFDVTTTYMPPPVGEDAPDPYRVTAQWSRRAIGLKVFMALASTGVHGYRRLIEHQVAMGDLLRARLREAGWEVVNPTMLPVICFTHPRIRSDRGATRRLLDQIESSGRVWISDTVLDPGSGSVLRACITSYETEPIDIEVLIEELQSALKAAT